MKNVPPLFWVGIVSIFLLVLLVLTLQAKRRKGVSEGISWQPLRYGLIALCLFSVTFLALQPLTAHAGITSNLTYILCGDASTFTNDIQIAGQWQHVTAGEIAYDPSGNAVAANGYAQQGHNVANSDERCNGSYQYGWDQYYHQATWTWPNTNLANGVCTVSVYIPTWFAGAPDAHYAVYIQSGATPPSSPVFTTTINQNQAYGGIWYPLNPNSGISIPVDGAAHSFIVTLTNGGGQGRWWYLGADAVKFDCTTSTLS